MTNVNTEHSPNWNRVYNLLSSTNLPEMELCTPEYKKLSREDAWEIILKEVGSYRHLLLHIDLLCSIDRCYKWDILTTEDRSELTEMFWKITLGKNIDACEIVPIEDFEFTVEDQLQILVYGRCSRLNNFIQQPVEKAAHKKIKEFIDLLYDFYSNY